MFVLSFKATRSATRKRSNFLSTLAQILLSQLVPNTGKAIVLHRTSHRARKVTNEHMHVSQKMLASEPTSLKESQKKFSMNKNCLFYPDKKRPSVISINSAAVT